MKKPSRARGKPAKARPRKAATLKRLNTPKVRGRGTRAPAQDTEIARVIRERDQALEQLSEALEQQTATAEILQVINRSPGDLTPVFDVMLEKAMRLCEAAFGQLAAYDGERFRISATRGVPAAFAEYRRNNPPNYGPGTTPSRILEGERVICTDDLKAEPAYQLGEPNRRALVDLGGARSALIVALRKDDAVLGFIQIYRQEVRPFSDKQIELMQNFATQAVIAIENTRLLGELRQSEERYMLVSEAVLEGIYEWDIETNSLWASPRIVELFGFPGRELSAADFNKLVHPEDFPHYRAALRDCFKGITARLDCEYRVRHSDGKYRWLEDRGVPVRNAAGRAVRLVGAQSDVTERKQGEQALREALEQQTATSEVLQAISSSPGELGPVFHTILSSATRLCEAKFATLYLHQAGEIRLVAAHDVPPAFADARKRGLRPAPDGALGGVIRTKQTLQVADVAALRPYAERDLRMRDAVELAGIRTVIAVPLLKDDELIGIIEIYRQELRPFTDKQIALVTSFASQAVIAIENTRLLNELRQRTDDLTESLEQQTATSDVLGVISRSKFELQPILQSVVDTAARLCRAEGGVIFRREDGIYRFAAGYSLDPAYLEIERKTPIVPGQGTVVGRAAMTGQVARIDDAWTDPLYEKKQEAKIGKGRSMIGVPLMREGEPIGVIGLARSRVDPFTEREIDLVATFADQAVIAIENVRLFEAEQQRSRELTESLQQQTATADVLKVISRSTFDLQSVLDTLIESAARLCAADKGTIQMQEGDVYRIRAHYGLAREAVQYALLQPLRPGRSSVTGRVALEGKAIHIPDVLADPEYHATDYQQAFGYRTILGVPLLRDGATIGVFALTRVEVSPFNEKQMELVTTFADQAVIAMENARLLNELRESLQQQSATSDVLKVISRSAFDLQTVLDTLVESAARLCDADSAAIHRPIGNSYPYVASYGYTREYHEYMRERPIIPGRGTVLGRAVTECKPVLVDDVEADPEYTLREGQRLGGFRTVLGIPLLREGVPIGVIILTRNTVRPFTNKQIELATTFADQAAIAIENVRLFEAEQQRTQELGRSIEELRTAQDRLVQTEKLASLGQLTAGIAHEIKNPLNFVNNFSAVSVELIDELQEALGSAHLDSKLRAEIAGIADMLRGNLDKVVQHGKRADAIVKNMLLHSRQGSGEHRPVDINALVEESLNLAYHGARAEKQGFNITLERSFDAAAGEVDLFPQEITRVLLNLISNGFYAATKRKADPNGGDYEPALVAATKNLGDRVEIRIRDNGTGIPPEVKEKLFSPFFTTKPAGEGTGLGLSISHDIIVKQHGGSIEVDTQPGEFTEFRIVLPRAGASLIKSGERA